MCQFAASSVKGIKPATGKYGTGAGLSAGSKQHLKGAMVHLDLNVLVFPQLSTPDYTMDL